MKSFIFAVTVLVFLSLTPLAAHSMGQESVDVKACLKRNAAPATALTERNQRVKRMRNGQRR